MNQIQISLLICSTALFSILYMIWRVGNKKWKASYEYLCKKLEKSNPEAFDFLKKK